MAFPSLVRSRSLQFSPLNLRQLWLRVDLSSPSSTTGNRTLVVCSHFSCFRSLQAKGGKDTKPATAKPKPAGVKLGMSTTVCSGANYFVNGTDPPLKDDGEYPDWLWTLLEEPSADDVNSKTYRRRQNKLKAHANNKQMQRQN